MESLSFRIPEQHPPTGDAFDTRPAAVIRWVEELPLGNTGEAAQRIYQTLKEVNSLAIPLGERLEMLEVLAVPLDSILAQLERHYATSHFPMPSKTLRIAEFANQLLLQVVIAYQAVLASEEKSSWLFRMTHSKQWSICVHRLLHYLGRILNNYRLLHRPYPSGVWLAVHRLFLEADKHGRTGVKVTVPWATEETETIADSYKRVLLLSLIEPQLFTRPQFESLHRHMALWLGEVKLRSPEKWREDMESLCIRLDQDTPHTVMAEQCHAEDGNNLPAMLLDISDLGELLDDALLGDPTAETVSLFDSRATLQRETVTLLRQCWHVPRGKREERYKTDKPVQVAVGMSAIFSLMRAESKRHRDGITDQLLKEDLKPLLPTGRKELRVSETSSPAQVWDTIFYGTEVMQNSWAMGGDEKNYQFITARELDYNAHGNCLEFQRGDLQSLDVGELIGFRESSEEKLQLYMVRWLQEKDEVMLVGLMRLASEMEPLLVVMEHDERDMALGCLLGIGEDARAQLFMPHLQAVREKPLSMVIDQRLIPISLREKGSLSPLFDGYRFDVLEELNVESLGGEMDLSQANSLLHAIAHSDETPSGPKDKGDFSDLWDSL